MKIDSPRLRFDNYPYGLSGGMCQRAMIAMALACEPSLLIADEPTTGLDATIQSKIVDLLAELKSELGITTMLISHDISIISRLSDSVAVMYGGTVFEYGPAKDDPVRRVQHQNIPIPRRCSRPSRARKNIKEKGYLQAIEGDVLDTINIPAGLPVLQPMQPGDGQDPGEVRTVRSRTCGRSRRDTRCGAGCILNEQTLINHTGHSAFALITAGRKR